VHTKEVAEEVVSDVFVKIWNTRKSIKEIQNIESYLFVSVKNQSLNCISADARSSIHISHTETPDLRAFMDVFDPEKELELQELQFNINLAIESLAPQCKAVFKLIKEDGLKYKEVAEILGVSVRTVETQLIRALQRLDTALTPYIESKLKQRKNNNHASSSARSVSKLILSFLV
jgi:RNA polymerase sigma-70 factor (ECF subfamily)